MTQFERKSHRARDHLLALSARYADAWGLAERFRAQADWPDWCFLPMPGWAVAQAQAVGKHPSQTALDPAAVVDVGLLAALGAWRMTQGIYRYDPEIYAAVTDTPLDRDIPVEVLTRLPEWCVYVETPRLRHGGENVAGAWVHLDYGTRTGQTKLRVVLDAGEDLEHLVVLGAPLQGTLQHSIEEAVTTSALRLGHHGQALPDFRRSSSEIVASIGTVLSLVLYICSAGADITQRGKALQPANPQPQQTRRQGTKLFAAAGPREWDVGVRLGAALRAAYQDAQGDGQPHQGPRGHVRRAHWHGFRTGPSKREDGSAIEAAARSLDVRWMPPIPVNLPDIEALPSTVKPVR